MENYKGKNKMENNSIKIIFGMMVKQINARTRIFSSYIKGDGALVLFSDGEEHAVLREELLEMFPEVEQLL